MIYIFIWLLLAGALESRLILHQRTTSCSWTGHCSGDRCSTYTDCITPLLCLRGKCGTLSDIQSNEQSGTCLFSGAIRGTNTKCNNLSTCCKNGVSYLQYKCSPSSTSSAILTLNSFQYSGSCYGEFYSSSQRVVALSTGWYNKGSRCGKVITIRGNGRTTTAMVVDECNSMNGCSNAYAGQPPCRNNIVDGSAAVWAALGIAKNDPRYGEINISWND